MSGPRIIAALALSLALSACGAGVVPPPKVGFTPATTPQASKGIMGADARALIHDLGDPLLDVRDPTARKLQFGNERCVLDAYLYAPGENREPVVTYADARQAGSGAPMAWEACARLLRER